MFGNGGNDRGVISMSEREKQRNRAPLRIVEAYWHGLCKEGAVPLRSEVDPRGMESALEYAFLMERISPTHGKIRVAGSHLSDLMGMQIAGMPVSSLIAPEDRAQFGKAVGRLFADPAVVRIVLKAEGGFGKPDMSAEMMLLPLRSDFGEISRALGVMITDGRIGRTPRRFRLVSVDVESAPTGGGAVDAPAEAIDETVKPLFEPAKMPRPAATRAAQQTPRPARRHLRLVVSNED